ncbi:MAG: hypothetical protein ABIR84_10870 [Candidatus Nitrotoga sp.]
MSKIVMQLASCMVRFSLNYASRKLRKELEVNIRAMYVSAIIKEIE